MELLNHGWDTLKRMPRPVAVYIGWLIVITISYRVFSTVLEDQLKEANPALFGLLRLGGTIALAAAAALVTAIYFAELGKGTDRPLWKCAGATDAARRFFLIWFLCNLVLLTTEQFLMAAAERSDDQASAILVPIYLFFSVSYLPVGACVMFYGKLHWPELGEALQPILRELSNVILVSFILFISILLQITIPFFFSLVLDPETPLALANLLLPALLILPVGVLECLAFVIMFQICMVHRSTDYDSDDFDF